jgi:hypothetical protein
VILQCAEEQGQAEVQELVAVLVHPEVQERSQANLHGT